MIILEFQCDEDLSGSLHHDLLLSTKIGNEDGGCFVDEFECDSPREFGFRFAAAAAKQTDFDCYYLLTKFDENSKQSLFYCFDYYYY